MTAAIDRTIAEMRTIADMNARDAKAMQTLRQHLASAGEAFDTIPIHFENYQDGDDRTVACLDQESVEVEVEHVSCGVGIEFVPRVVEFTRYVGDEPVRCRAKLAATTLRYSVEVVE